MGAHHPLRMARRTRCVDDVREVVGAASNGRIRVRIFVRGGELWFEINSVGVGGGDEIAKARLHQQHSSRAVCPQDGQPLRREAWIERQVGAARLEDADERYDHLDRSLSADADDMVRPDAERT